MITVFGLGFVGLTTALGFSHFGKRVYGIDTNQERVAILKNNSLPFLEPHLDIALAEHNNRNFIITDDVQNAIANSEYIFYCVGTPYGENGEADLHYLFSALKDTFPYMNKEKPKTLIIKSTIPPSTTKEKIIPFIEEHGWSVGDDVYVANNPEFLREGHCWEDFIYADRIVIGSDNEETVDRLKNLYEAFNVPIFAVSSNTGEYIKYLSNTLLATLISYSNEMADVAEHIGNIDVTKAFNILHMDKRWNKCNMTSYVYPGCGYGGYCLPKDTNALYTIAKVKGRNAEILGNVIKTNNNMPKIIANRIEKHISNDKKIGILGLSFKPNSNDVRDCASAKIINELQKKGYCNICGYDPVAINEFKEYYNLNMDYKYNLEDICEYADALIILTAWSEFKKVKNRIDKLVLDYRYM
ncbi:UDP-glucose dehydrogenase family protein [Vallitalea guaymasensis]|uniref:UDP-glucose dehydrogenase family protein n=1 Tax=Vallitalea guaymasensis TaxID=1185412 RepID=UPI00187D4864|nr:nucleotide sugar dehydrogenase [Vallitalea guaymasensis]